jgi:hypothetical protein
MSILPDKGEDSPVHHYAESLASDQSYELLEIDHQAHGLLGLTEEGTVSESKGNIGSHSNDIHMSRSSVVAPRQRKKSVDSCNGSDIKEDNDPALEPLEFSLPKHTQMEHRPPVFSHPLIHNSRNQCCDRGVYR